VTEIPCISTKASPRGRPSAVWWRTAPVFIGDTITATAEVVSVHERKPVCELKIRVERDDGEIVLAGEAWCYRFLADEA
jgi:acyl-coenzyme A thioesterase PaaI-like protein